MAHSHDHATHSHSHAPASLGRAFAIGIGLNTAFVILEAIFGFVANSTALLADAGHNLSDVLGLFVAWGAVALSRRPPTATFTYGLRASSILAALFNAMFLLLAIGAIGWEAIQRFSHPESISAPIVIAVAAAGIVINGVTALLFASGRKDDINIEGAFLHMAADAAVSAGVVVAALVYIYTGWNWVDPAVSLAICAVIVWGTWGLLKNSVRMSLGGVPPRISPALVRAFLESRSGVAQLHDLHIWAISSTDTALTCHLVIPAGHPGDSFLTELAHDLEHRFGIGHVTVQIEVSEETACALESDAVV